ncbi:MAG: hypothetical protein RLZZ214_3136, partial [Verrucomicrobiota bacterium]
MPALQLCNSGSRNCRPGRVAARGRTHHPIFEVNCFPKFLLLPLLLVGARPLAAAEVPPASPLAVAGTLVTAPDWRSAMLAGWKTPPPFGTAEASEAGVRLLTRQQPEHRYSLQARLPNLVALRKDDTLLLRFAARSLQPDAATGVTKIRVSFSNRSYSGELGLGSGWQRFDIPFTCSEDFQPNAAALLIAFGYPAQVAELADLQLLRFGPEIAPASLPKTRRFADVFPPEVVTREIARIAAMRSQLAAERAPATGGTLHVSPQGRAAGKGTAEAPFASIPRALAVVKPGETILVAAGNYREPRGINVTVSGRPDAWIKIKAAPGPRPKLISSGWSGFALNRGVAYLEIEGFELEWVPDPAAKGKIDSVGIAPAYASHHLRFINNVIHGFGTGGICSLDCDYLHVEGNLIYDTAKTSPYGGSAISLCRAFNFDEAPGYHNVVRGNVCHDNELRVAVLATSGGNGRILTDGNGIIIDVFQRSRANPLKPHHQDRGGKLEPYRGRTLVENNLLYDNGGRGIHAFRSEKVDVINNTCYMNQKSADINAGEFTAIESGEVVFLNNIAYGRREKRGNAQDGSTRV